MSHSARFSNRQNERIEVSPGRVLFDSRSVAVVAVIIAHEASTNSFYALAGLRGPAVDNSGLWCLVCGYLDWDESLADAVRREVYEEAGLDLAALESTGQAFVPTQPVWVQSDPKTHRQNVSARFPVELTSRVPPSIANAEPGEVLEIAWVPVTRAEVAARSWAFNHDKILGDLADWYDKEHAAGVLDIKSTRRYYRFHLLQHYPFLE